MSSRIPKWTWFEWLQSGMNFFIVIIGCIFIGIMVQIILAHQTDMLLNLVFAGLAAALVMTGFNHQSILFKDNYSKEMSEKIMEMQNQLDRIERK